MKRKRYTEPQIVFALQQAESGTAVAEICRMMGHSRLDTTGIYLSATAEDLKEAMLHHPLT